MLCLALHIFLFSVLFARQITCKLPVVVVLLLILLITINSMPYWSVAVLTNVFQSDRFCARRHAVFRPMLAGRKSSSTVRMQVCPGWPRGLFQVAGTPLIDARSTRQRSMDDSDLAVWPNSVRRLEPIISVAGMQPVQLLAAVGRRKLPVNKCVMFCIASSTRRHRVLWDRVSGCETGVSG